MAPGRGSPEKETNLPDTLPQVLCLLEEGYPFYTDVYRTVEDPLVHSRDHRGKVPRDKKNINVASRNRSYSKMQGDPHKW